MGVMKIGYIAHRVGIEPTPLAFRVSVLIVTPPKLPNATTVLTPTMLLA